MHNKATNTSQIEHPRAPMKHIKQVGTQCNWRAIPGGTCGRSPHKLHLELAASASMADKTSGGTSNSRAKRKIGRSWVPTELGVPFFQLPELLNKTTRTEPC